MALLRSGTLLLALAAATLAPASASAEQESSTARSIQSGQIAAGDFHSCAIVADGTVRCWGDGPQGQLGYGDTEDVGDDETPGEAGPVDLGAGRSAVAITAGGLHTCALLDDGSVRCWGLGDSGRLGYGDTENVGDDETPGSAGPVDLGAGRSAVAITAGNAHTCALLDDGTVRCWGSGQLGRLGYGDTANVGDVGTPGSVGTVDLGAGRRAVAISAGGSHTCALLDDGTVRCWGSGARGKLGYGDTADIGDNETPGTAGPVDLGVDGRGFGHGAVGITAGGRHTCALLDDGTARCWGEGADGQLGYGNLLDVGDDETPRDAGSIDLGRSAVALTAGDSHTCAALDDGTVRCWGFGLSGRLGYGDTESVGDGETPGSVGPVDLGGRSAVAIAAGESHTCAALDDGNLRCWGNGGEGRLGYGNTEDVGDNEAPGSVGPVDLDFERGKHAVAVSAGESHSCALLDDGTVRCWGRGQFGRLGYGDTESIGDDEAPGEVGPVDLGGRNAVAISAGGSHTCAILDNGTVRCWGGGQFGRLGYGDTANVGDDEAPGSVGPVDLGAGRSAVAIAAGYDHSCALLDDGSVRCWGFGGNGQLGYGNLVDVGDNEAPGSVGPVDLGDGRNAVAIAAGASHTCARLDDGSVRCWGGSQFGQLGYGNLVDVDDPGPVGPVDLGAGRNAVAIAVDSFNTCARLDDGSVRCWGRGEFGQLGYGNLLDVGDDEAPGSVGPVDLGAGRSAVAISARSQHSCALLDDGTVRCWGMGDNGRLGYGNTQNVGDDETPGSVGPVSISSPPVDPPPPAPAATASADPTPLPPPVLGRSVDVEPVAGVVAIKCPGDGAFARLQAAANIPVGCLIDSRRGTVLLTSARGGNGGTQSARFWDGIFRILQKAAPGSATELKLAGPLECPKRQARRSNVATGPEGPAEASRGRRGGRRLWGNGKGNFKTIGKYGSAGVRGTIWLVADRCDDSTLFKVRQGTVSVRDFVRKRSIVLRKGKSYVAGGKRG